MSLIKCAACGNEVSIEAAACLKCGHPIKATPAGGINMKDPVHIVGVIAVGVILLGILWAIIEALASRNVY